MRPVGGGTAHDGTANVSHDSDVRPAAAVGVDGTRTAADPGPDGLDADIVTGSDETGAMVRSGEITDSPAVAKGSRGRAVAVLVAVAILAVVADIVTKQLVITHLREGQPARIIPGVLYFDLIRNGGAAFSMGTRVTWVFPTIAIVVVAAIAYLSTRLRSIGWAISLGLVVGGALGNLIDRLFRAPGPFRGEVVDFISLFSNSGRGFAIFNFADSCLTIGVILAVLLELTGRHRDGTRSRS